MVIATVAAAAMNRRRKRFSFDFLWVKAAATAVSDWQQKQQLIHFHSLKPKNQISVICCSFALKNCHFIQKLSIAKRQPRKHCNTITKSVHPKSISSLRHSCLFGWVDWAGLNWVKIVAMVRCLSFIKSQSITMQTMPEKNLQRNKIKRSKTCGRCV